MARLRSAPLRRGSPASSPDNSDEEPDPSPRDDEVLKDDFLEGLPDEAQDSPFHDDNDDGANPQSLQEESEDEPNSQIQREAQSARSLGNNRKLTDEEQAAFMDSAALLSHGRGPAPLPSKAERRAASRDGHSTTSTPRSAKRSAHPEVHVVSGNYKPNYASASASAQPETQAEDDKGSEGRQLRRSTKAQRPQKDKEDAAVAAPVSKVPQKRKPGRPKKTATNAEIIKRHKTDSAKTGQRQPKTGEAVQSDEGNRRIESKIATTATPSGSKKSKSMPKQPMTSSEKLSQMKSKRIDEQETSEHEEEASEYEEEASEHEQKVSEHEQANEGSEEESSEALTTESHSGVPTYPPQIDGPDDLKEFLSEIWKNNQGVRKVIQQRTLKGLEKHNDSTERVLQACSDIMKDIKHVAKPSTKLTDVKSAQVRDAVAILTSELAKFDLANKREINDFLFQDLYAFILPDLLEALCKIVDFYAQFFCGYDSSIRTAQLEEIAFFMAAIIGLNERAKSSGVQVAPNLGIVKPARHHIIAPLRKCHNLLLQLIRKQTKRDEREQALQNEKRRTEEARIRREREAEEEAPRRALLEDWRRLHILRKDIEPDCRRWRHLDAIPPPSAREPELIRDIDVNGQPFDRVVMFHHPRTNPRKHSLEMTQELVGVDWTDLECLTLMEALAKYTAMEFSKPRYMVYSKIIKSHCRPEGALRRFNVLEIVQKSQYLKRMLGDREWTERIPTF